MSRNALTTLAVAAVLTVGWQVHAEIADAQPARRAGDDSARQLSAGNTIGDLLRHPALAGFARLLLPWDDRACDERME